MVAYQYGPGDVVDWLRPRGYVRCEVVEALPGGAVLISGPSWEEWLVDPWELRLVEVAVPDHPWRDPDAPCSPLDNEASHGQV